MITFCTISTVRKDIEDYQSKDCYAGCCDALCAFFKGKSIETIYGQPIAIAEHNGIKLIKSRIKAKNQGKRGGYRIYYYVDSKAALVYIIKFYPKTGPCKKENVSKAELKELKDEWKQERDDGQLKTHSITNEFSYQ